MSNKLKKKPRCPVPTMSITRQDLGLERSPCVTISSRIVVIIIKLSMNFYMIIIFEDFESINNTSFNNSRFKLQ